jgi:hypothetical protein
VDCERGFVNVMLFKPGLMKAAATIEEPASGPIITLVYVAHTTSAAASIVAPAAINAGDLLILVQRGRDSASIPTSVVPGDFTTVNSSGVNQVQLNICYKIADGTEDGATITGIDGNADDGKVLWQYRANAPIISLTAAGWVSINSSSAPAQQTIAASGGTGIVLGISAFSCNSSLGSVDPRTTSITPDHEATASTAFYSHDYIQISSPANYTIDMLDEGNNNSLFGCYFHNMQT